MLLLAAQPKVASVAVIAIQQIRRMRGGAQSHLMLASDDNLYVVKFRNNPQHVRVLANELLATRLAAAIGLAVPPSRSHRSQRVADPEHTRSEHRAARRGAAMPGRPALRLALGGRADARADGRLSAPGAVAGGPQSGRVRRRSGTRQVDLQHQRTAGGVSERPAGTPLPRHLHRPGILFSCRGLEIHRRQPGRCFCRKHACTAGSPAGTASSLGSAASRTWPPETAWGIAEIIPPEWYGGDLSALEVLVERLLARRGRVRELIVAIQGIGAPALS